MERAAIVWVALGCLLAYVHSECLDSEGNQHANGTEPYIGPDACNTCHCSNGESVCTKMFCTPGHKRCMGTDGQIHTEGESFKSSDGCNTCTCTEHGVTCTEMACSPSDVVECHHPLTGKIYQVGESFLSSDGCNTCYCWGAGMIACTGKASCRHS